MQTECISDQLEFQGLGRQEVVGRFDGGRTTSDGGLLALREVAERSGMLKRFAQCFTDYRSATRIEHTVEELIGQRVLANACGYEDLNDHHALRDDALLALAAGKRDIEGSGRVRQRDRGHALAGAATLNRLELTPADATAASRYKKIVYDGKAIERFFVDIKEQQLDLFADRTSTHTMRANQLRLWLASLSYVLVNEMRRVGLTGTQYARAQVGTIRTRLLKIAGIVKLSVRRVMISLSSVFPLQDLFARMLANIRRAYPLPS